MYIAHESRLLNGGFYEKNGEEAAPSAVIGVGDIREAMRKVTEARGTVLGGTKPGEPDDIPGVGLFAAFTDTEGNRVSLLQPADMGDAPERKQS